MSFFFLPTDTWIPAKSNSEVNPIISVWLRSSLVNCLSVAPVIPILRGWALYVSHRSLTPSTPSHSYKGSVDAILKTGRGLNVFRGFLPLIGAIPLTSAFALSTSLSCLIFTTPMDPYSSAATAIASVIAGEILVQPFRYFYLRKAMDATSIITYPHLWRSTSWATMYRGIGLFSAASALLQIAPHSFRYFGLDTSLEYHIPAYACLGLASYACYVTGFRRISTRYIQDAPTLFGSLRRHSPWTLFAGLLSLATTRAVVVTLQAHFSAKSDVIPI